MSNVGEESWQSSNLNLLKSSERCKVDCLSSICTSMSETKEKDESLLKESVERWCINGGGYAFEMCSDLLFYN